MKVYLKPIIEEIVVDTTDILTVSGIELNNTNAGFNLPDEVL